MTQMGGGGGAENTNKISKKVGGLQPAPAPPPPIGPVLVVQFGQTVAKESRKVGSWGCKWKIR